MSGNRITLPTKSYNPLPGTNEITGSWENETIDYITSINNYRLPAYHRLDIGANLHVKRCQRQRGCVEFQPLQRLLQHERYRDKEAHACSRQRCRLREAAHDSTDSFGVLHPEILTAMSRIRLIIQLIVTTALVTACTSTIDIDENGSQVLVLNSLVTPDATISASITRMEPQREPPRCNAG